jgi:hypothetical protein
MQNVYPAEYRLQESLGLREQQGSLIRGDADRKWLPAMEPKFPRNQQKKSSPSDFNENDSTPRP